MLNTDPSIFVFIGAAPKAEQSMSFAVTSSNYCTSIVNLKAYEKDASDLGVVGCFTHILNLCPLSTTG